VNEINFLPPAYQIEQARQRRTFFQAALIVLVMAAMGVWYSVSSRQVAALEREAGAVEAESVSSTRNAAQIQTLQRRQAALSRQINLQRELVAPLGPSQVLAILGELTPGGVTLTSLSMTGQRVNLEPKAAASGSGTSGPGGKTQTATDPLTLHLAGVALNETEVANIVGRLNGHPLFRNVKMSFSRPIVLGNLTGREFQIEMEVDMDRDFQIRRAGEVADAR
jgi:hypothetical protein